MRTPPASEAQVREVERLLADNVPVGEILKIAGVSCQVFYKIRKGRHFWQQSPEERERRRRSGGGVRGRADQALPTPAEIVAACERFRAERRRRSMGRQRWRLPVVSTTEL